MTKNSVLKILRKENDYVSGEKISNLLGVSRTAVNTAVKSLRKEGYGIQSSTNKGYLLTAAPDCLTAAELSAYITEQRMKSVLCVDTVDSTNNKLRELALSGATEGQIVVANEQLGGRGRRGRNFISPKDKGIYLSMLLKPNSLPSDIIEITMWTAVAVNNAIYTVCGIRAGIKWVNDLVINRRKVCGILTETSVESENGYVQYVIIGIGINVNEGTDDFPKELCDIATSLSAETGKAYSRAQLVSELIKELDLMRSAWPQESKQYLDAYRSDNITVGKDLYIVQNSVKKEGVATSINDDFSLNVRYRDGSSATLSGGEISICGMYGNC